MPSTTQLIQVDAFTNERFRGNAAAVCLLSAEKPAEWMQAVAAEMNLSETAFVLRRAEGGFALRWFTPTVEVPLCGHATLASAHVLYEQGLVPADEPVTFHATCGQLGARREGDWICLDFPAYAAEPSTPLPGLVEALGCRPVSVHRDQLAHYLLDLDSESAVRALQPDFTRLREVDCDACIVTARGEPGPADFVSRFFAPRMGIDEDPVTGAAHCTLGPYWAQRLGKAELTGRQVSKRGGTVRVRVRGERVDLLGQAVTVFRTELVE